MKKIITKLGSNGLYLILLGLIIVLNIVLTPFAYKADLSKGKAHTLSGSTKSVIRNLKKNAKITFFVSDPLPSRLIPLKREVDDVLSEYKRDAGGKIAVEYVDPKNDQKKLALAQEYGVAPIQVSQQESDKFAISTAYFGLGIAANDKKAAIPQATGVGDLEYNITSSFYKLEIKELPTVGLMGSEGAENQLNSFAQAVSSQFQLAPVATPTAAVKTLVVFDNTQPLSKEQIEQLDSYLNNGGKAVVFAEGVRISEDSSLTAQKADNPLTSLLRKHGITLNQDLVLSANADFVNFSPQGSQTQLMVPYPYWIRTNIYDHESSFFSNISQLSFPWTSSVSVSGAAKPLVKTTTQSWRIDKDFNLDPQQVAQPAAGQIAQFNLIARSTGAKKSDLIVIPSSRFIFDRYMSPESGNLEFVINVLSEFASGGALAGIRARAVDYYLIPPMNAAQKNMFKYANILTLPGIFTAFMMFRMYRRNRQFARNA